MRYYIIDFELAVRFPADVHPSRRLITGLPILRLGRTQAGDYGRDVAPEMLLPAPHDPFMADVYQLGCVFHTHFHVSDARIHRAAGLTRTPKASPTHIPWPY